MAELDPVAPLAAGQAGQVAGVGRHFRERHFRVHGLHVAAGCFHPQGATAAAGEIAVDVAELVVGHGHVQLDDRLQQAGLGFLEHVAEGHRTGRLEGRFRAVHRVILAEVDLHADVDHAAAGDHAAGDPLLEPLFHGGQEVVGNGAAHDRVHPEEVGLLVVVVFTHRGELGLGAELLGIGAGREGEHADVHFAKLAASAGLLLVPVASLSLGLNRFAVGNLGLVGVDFHLVAAGEPLLDDLQVQLAHADHDQLFGLGIAVVL